MEFKRDNVPIHHSLYERACRFAGKTLPISGGKREKDIAAYLAAAHVDCRPGDTVSLALLAPIVVVFLSIVLTVFVPYSLGGSLSSYWLLFSLILGVMAYIPLKNMPQFLAMRWRQQASNQMVIAVFYIVTFMRHTPNLELALEFAADHIGAPLALDLKKVLWDVETERFQSVTESLEDYLVQWRDDAREFIEALHLVQSSLYETSNDRRLSSLDKSLDVMLEETYEKMLHYAQDLKGPMTMLHMLGIVLPILGLVILPLAVSFFETSWTIIFSFYNIILPFAVYYLGRRILATRPTGYGQSDIAAAQLNTAKKKFASPAFKAFALAAVLLFIGVSPLIIHAASPTFDAHIGNFKLLGYQNENGVLKGPFGLGAGLLSLLVTLAAGLGLGMFYRSRAKDLIKRRDETRRLESEFASALFQLGNRIGDGSPSEIAFSKVAAVMEGTTAGRFFALASNNITSLGMGVKDALFDPHRGAVTQFPSALIESSMKVLVESSKKGPVEASKALMSMSNYIKEMHRVDERLKDLLSDVLSSMKSQINFLLPTIAGIVIGITSMITTVLGAIHTQEQQLGSTGGAGSSSLGIGSNLFHLGVPTYFFQIVVGLYVVQVTWILAYLINGVENGIDPLSEDWTRGKSLLYATILYTVIALVIILIFNVIAGQIMSSLG